MVDKVLFKPWQDVEIENVSHSVSKAGWAPIPEGFRWLNKSFPDGDPIFAVDKTAWDWTMPGWVIKPYYLSKIAQCRGPTPDYIRATCARIVEVLRDPIVRLPDGTRYMQTTEGIMKSGWYLTLSMNSAAQFFQHALAWRRAGGIEPSPLIWAMGDDMLINFSGCYTPGENKLVRPGHVKRIVQAGRKYADELEHTGCILKHLDPVKEFAGFVFTNDSVTPLYQDKHRFIMSYVKPDREQQTLLSMCLLYSMTPNFGWLSAFRWRMDFPLGATFRRWAQGLASLAALTSDPEWLQ